MTTEPFFMPNKFGKTPGRFSAIRQELVWVVVGMLMSMVGGLLTIKILSNMLEKDAFGLYSLLFSIVSLLVSVLFTTLGQINLRYIFIARKAGLVGEFRVIQKRIFIGMLIASAVVLAPCVYWFGGVEGNRIQAYIVLLLLTFMMGNQIAQQYMLMAFRLRKEISFSQIAGAIARPVGVYLCIIWLGRDSLFALYGLVFGFAVLSVAQYYYLSRQWKILGDDQAQPAAKPEGEMNALRPAGYLSYGFMYSLVGLVTITVLAADRWVLSFSGSLEQVAIYAALMQIALAPTAFGHAVLTRLAAPIYFGLKDHSKDIQTSRFRLLLLFWLTICITIMIVTVLFHTQIVRLLTNDSFATYSYLLPWMVAAMLFERTTQVLELKGALMLKTHVYIVPRIGLVIMIPLLEYLFLKSFGFDWLVIGLVIATGGGMVATLFINHFYAD